MSLTDLVLCCSIVMIAAILQVSVGMGFGMLASPLIALVRPDFVPGSILLMGLVVAFAGAWRERSNISIVEMKLGVVGRVIGSIIAVLLLGMIASIDSFLVLFGTIMLVAVALSASGIQFEFNNKNLFGLSVVSGTMGTITAVGAPPMAIIYHDRNPAVVRPTLNAFFFANSVLGLIGLVAAGWLTWNDLVASIVFFPAMVLGILVSGPFKALPSQMLSRLLLALSGIASVTLIYRGLV